MSVSQSVPCTAEQSSSEGIKKSAQGENTLKGPVDQPDDMPPTPHMNVIVKEEEEEEPLCGTRHYRFLSVRLKKVCSSLIFMCCFFVFFPVEEIPEQVPVGEDCTIPEETEKQHQESSTEISIKVKEEEEQPLNSKENTRRQMLLLINNNSNKKFVRCDLAKYKLFMSRNFAPNLHCNTL